MRLQVHPDQIELFLVAQNSITGTAQVPEPTPKLAGGCFIRRDFQWSMQLLVEVLQRGG